MKSNIMNVLILSLNYPPEGGSAAAKMQDLAYKLYEKGHNVAVVTEMPNYPKGIIHDEYKGKIFSIKKENGILVYRTWVYASPERQKFLPRLLNYTSFMFSSIYGGLRAFSPDIIYVYSPPPLLGITATFLGKIYNCPYILMVNDLWPQAAIFLGFLKNRWLIKIAKILEIFVYKHAERIFVYSEKMADQIYSSLGFKSEKVEVYPLWIDTEFFKPISADYRNKFGLKNKFIVMYAGIMSFAQGIDNLIKAANILKNNKDIFFILIGEGPQKRKLEEMIKHYNLKNVKFIRQQPIDKMPYFFSMADVLFVHLNKAPHRIGTIPEKTLAYISCGKPVIMGAEGAAADLVIENNCGVVVEPENPKAIAEGILRLYNNEKLREELSKNARYTAVHKFDKNLVLEKIEQRLRDIATNYKQRQNDKASYRKTI